MRHWFVQPAAMFIDMHMERLAGALQRLPSRVCCAIQRLVLFLTAFANSLPDGGAGGIEAGITVLALRDQCVPPTINQENPDPECDLDYVPNKPRRAHLEYALTNSFGFGGTNGCLLFKRWAE